MPNVREPAQSPRGDLLVVGAGMTGLMVARALAPLARRVTVVDHDDLSGDRLYRSGASQMYHSHALLDRGLELIEDLFPGLVDATSLPVSRPNDHGANLLWHQYGTWKPRVETGVDVWQFDRARIEAEMRAEVRSMSNVDLRSGEKVVGYLWDGEHRIRGVEVESDGARERRSAALVVDAMGRGTRTPRLLENSEIGPVPSRSYEPRVTYTTGDFDWPDSYRGDWSGLLVMPDSPETPLAGIAYPIDRNRFRVTLAGWLGRRAPADASGFRSFAADLPTPRIAELLDEMTLQGSLRRYRIPEVHFRRFDEMQDRPDGLVAVGDSLCSFNPIFGQGISMAAREVAVLRQLAHESDGDRILPLDAVETYDRRAAAHLRIPWLMTAAYDHQFPGMEGDEQLPSLLTPVVRFLHRASGHHPEVFRSLVRVMHMQKSPIHLMRPGCLGPLASSALGRTG